jgi:integrase
VAWLFWRNAIPGRGYESFRDRHLPGLGNNRGNVSLRIEQHQNIVYISKQIGHSSVKTTLDVYGHLMKEVNTEQAKKLDNALGLVGDSGNSLGVLEDC